MNKTYIKDLIWIILIPVIIGVILGVFALITGANINGIACTGLRCFELSIILNIIFIPIIVAFRLVRRIKNVQPNQKNFKILLIALILDIGFFLFIIGYISSSLFTLGG